MERSIIVTWPTFWYSIQSLVSLWWKINKMGTARSGWGRGANKPPFGKMILKLQWKSNRLKNLWNPPWNSTIFGKWPQFQNPGNIAPVWKHWWKWTWIHLKAPPPPSLWTICFRLQGNLGQPVSHLRLSQFLVVSVWISNGEDWRIEAKSCWIMVVADYNGK
jgi:hypothetical protein